MQTCRDIGEFELIQRIQRLIPSQKGLVPLEIGDDAAAIHCDPEQLILSTVDSQVEGVHFEWPYTSPEKLGWKLAAINISDIAAMGGTPLYALVNLALPPQMPVATVEAFYTGLAEALRSFSATIVGGNLSASKHFMADLTLLGQVPPNHLKTRSAARPGDLICVTGSLGKGNAGFILAKNTRIDFAEKNRLLSYWQTPIPRLMAGKILGSLQEVHAIIDISDGLAGDLTHLCEASVVGAIISEKSLPIEPAVKALAKNLNQSVLQWALYGGEDYELLFAIPAKDFANIKQKLEPVIPVTVIGHITEVDQGLRIEKSNGKTVPIEAKAWDHFR